jgi:4-nitrophenyl phosphatase
MELPNLKTLLIDGDGVLWHSNTPMPGLNHFFDVLEQRRINWALLTNNASRTLGDYVDKLCGFGIKTREDQVYTSASVTASYLSKRYQAGDALYVVAGAGAKTHLREAGFIVYDGEDQPDKVVAVVGGVDFDISYQKLTVAGRLVLGGADWVATNPDRTFPAPDGIMPGAGSIVAAIEAVVGRAPYFIGKPEPAIFEEAMATLNANPDTTAMLGDRVETDILGAQRLGLGTILVLSGVTDRERLATFDYQPDMIYEDISELASVLEALDG